MDKDPEDKQGERVVFLIGPAFRRGFDFSLPFQAQMSVCVGLCSRVRGGCNCLPA